MNRNLPRSPRQPLFFAAAAYSAGLCAGTYLWRPASWWLAAATAFVLFATGLRNRRFRGAFLLGLAAVFLVGAFVSQGRPQSSANFDVLQFAGGETVVTAHVIKVALPHDLGNGASAQRVDLETETIQTGSFISRVNSGLRATFYSKPAADASDISAAIPRFVYGTRLRFPPKFHHPEYFVILAHSTIATTLPKMASPPWRPRRRQRFRSFRVSSEVASNSGALVFLAASRVRFVPSGRPGKLRWSRPCSSVKNHFWDAASKPIFSGPEPTTCW